MTTLCQLIHQLLDGDVIERNAVLRGKLLEIR